jgi:GTP-binding protein LepA
VILVVDATQGIEAQTLSNLYMAIEHDLVIIPVLNKIDLPSADIERTKREVISLIGCREEDIICVSAKVGTNVEDVLDAVVERIPEPRSVAAEGKIIPNNAPGKIPDSVKLGLIFDSQYDSYRGVVIYIKLFSGEIKRGDKITLMNTNTIVEILEVGCFQPEYKALTSLKSGEIGYIVTGIKTLQEARVGDTIFAGAEEYKHPIPGFQQVAPYVFAGVYPVDTEDYNQLKTDIEKLKMSDSSLTNEHEVSPALGHGFRCGFLGLLHMEIVKERLDREFDIDVILTSPQVTYQVMMPGDHSHDFKNTPLKLEKLGDRTFTRLWIKNPERLPEPGTYDWIEEPIVKLEIISRSDMIGEMMKLAQEHRGIYKNQTYIDETRSIITYEIPMAEIITDFYDDLKSRSSGYASMSYEQLNYKRDDLIKVDILVNNERI